MLHTPGWPKRCKLAHAFLWEYSYKRLTQLLGQLGVFLTLAPGVATSVPQARFHGLTCRFAFCRTCGGGSPDQDQSKTKTITKTTAKVSAKTITVFSALHYATTTLSVPT